MESPGGSLFEAMCIAQLLKTLDVTSVVTDIPMSGINGYTVHNPGHYTESSNNLASQGEDRVVICASACSLLFLGGDDRKLIGNVYLGIHAPRSKSPFISPLRAEAQAYRLSAYLLRYLQHTLLVENDDLRRLFISVPAKSMYYIQPRHFEEYPWLKEIATHYYDFHDYTFVPSEITNY
jgi:hypothetical protein